MTSCTRTVDLYDDGTAGTGSQVSNTYINTGTCFITAPRAGYYNICFHGRFKLGGNAGDVTVQVGGTQFAAAFGDADERDWRSTGICFPAVTIPSFYLSDYKPFPTS